MIKLIIFDLWNTISYKKYKEGSIHDIHDELKTKINHRKFLKTFEKNFQISKISYDKSFKNMLDELKIKYDDGLIKKLVKKREKYQSIFLFYEYLFPLLKELKKKYKIALLSNTTYQLGERIKKSKLKYYFDKLFFSYELKAIKPDPKTFKAVLSYFKIRPSEALMIGDTYLDDVVSAKKLGINAIHFKNGAQLKRDLKKMGVL
jgi:HAD superfamily hydrolase (TIGR01549 family)